jgi:hypothetical protein
MTEDKLSDFYEAYNWLVEHPIFQGHFPCCMDIEVVKVNPETDEIDDNDDLNTKTAVWLENGPVDLNESIIYSHDIDLDCGADTFEEAICIMAKLVLKRYGDYKINY